MRRKAGGSMFTVSLRAVALYIVSVIAVRIMGKRQIGQLQPYELVLAILIADLAAAPMENVGTPLMYGVMPILALLSVHAFLTLLDLKSLRVRKILCSAPSVIIRKGSVCYDEMKRVNYTLSDLCEELRSQGFLNLAKVDTAILETSGRLSVFPAAEYAPLTPKDMGCPAKREGVPLLLIMDGRTRPEHLKAAGKDETWLMGQLQKAGIWETEQVLVASLDTDGRLLIQEKAKGAERILLNALAPEEVIW